MDDEQIAELKQLIAEEKARKKAVRARYVASDKWKAATARYNASDKHKATQARAKAKRRERQAGRSRVDACECCGKETKTAYDHCHETNTFRGWLCHQCNAALGMVKDDVIILQKLIEYVNNHRRKHGDDNKPSTVVE